MSPTYTREQIYRARIKADQQHDFGTHDGRDWIDALATELGLTVEPEKPAPGRYRVDYSGEYAIVADKHGKAILTIMGDDGTARFSYPEDEWPALTPARVIPAEAGHGALDPHRADVRALIARAIREEADRLMRESNYNRAHPSAWLNMRADAIEKGGEA